MANNAPLKSLSFDSRILDENKVKNEDRNVGKSFSFASRSTSFKSDHDDSIPPTIDEGGEEEQSECREFTMEELSEEIDTFLQSANSLPADAGETGELREISASVIMFLKKLEMMIEGYESTSETTAVIGRNVDEDSLFLSAVNRLSSLITVLNGYKSNHTMPLLNQASLILHRVMVFLEDELRLLLAESAGLTPDNNSKTKNGKAVVASPKDHQQHAEGDQSLSSDQNLDSAESVEESPPTFPYYSPEAVTSIRLVSNAMHNAGYEAECISIFIIVRRHAIEEEVKKHGFDKISVDDVQKMNWGSLEEEIATWIRVFKHCSNELFPGEEKFYESVFSDHISTKQFLFCDISLAVSSILISFAEAVSMTKRSTEKLFKFLDMYEALRDWTPSTMLSEEVTEELRSEVSFAKSRLGEAAVTIFCLLENSIKGDNTKTPVPNGAVHPLTRYTMNYFQFTCAYKDTLEQVFQQHLKADESEEYPSDTEQPNGGRNVETEKHSPFSSQMITIMDLLDAYLDSKSKLYKDLSLRYIFLMNNGRYMLQKVKGSAEIHQVVGDNWCRKRSSDVRQYHKSYQRESWYRVLQCLNQEGLQVNGKVHKPILKERFKNFNQLFDEIHKTQSTWVVSDEQLQSELRVSISAVMTPAYRSFVARFGQIFTPGRQVEKYIKFQPDDIENAIEELFDGNTNSMAKRKG